MGTWSENWKATHSNFVRANKEVRDVLEHRKVEKGELYCVAIEGGGFEVRHYEGEKLKTKVAYPSGMKAVIAYRELRDKLVPGRVAPKKAAPKVEVITKKGKKAASKTIIKGGNPAKPKSLPKTLVNK